VESEFRVKNPTPAPGYAQAVISALRQTRKENPLTDAAASFVPGVSVGQAAMDVTDPDASDFQRMLAVGSILPGMRLMRTIAGRLRGAKAVEKVVEEAKPFSAEEIFQKPDVKMTAEQRAANLAAKNEEARKIAEQWLAANP
jgi:hypothetical protein